MRRRFYQVASLQDLFKSVKADVTLDFLEEEEEEQEEEEGEEEEEKKKKNCDEEEL